MSKHLLHFISETTTTSTEGTGGIALSNKLTGTLDYKMAKGKVRRVFVGLALIHPPFE